MGIDDEGEFAQQVRAAQCVAAVGVAQTRGPAVVDRDAGVAGDDADGLDGLASAFSVEPFRGEGAGAVYMNPVVGPVHT